MYPDHHCTVTSVQLWMDWPASMHMESKTYSPKSNYLFVHFCYSLLINEKLITCILWNFESVCCMSYFNWSGWIKWKNMWVDKGQGRREKCILWGGSPAEVGALRDESSCIKWVGGGEKWKGAWKLTEGRWKWCCYAYERVSGVLGSLDQ